MINRSETAMDRRQTTWTLDRKVTLSGAIACLTFAGGLFAVWYTAMDRITKVELAMQYQKGINDQLKDSQKEIKADTLSAINDVKSAVKDLSQKVDRALERK
jgi:hypothetical protein